MYFFWLVTITILWVLVESTLIGNGLDSADRILRPHNSAAFIASASDLLNFNHSQVLAVIYVVEDVSDVPVGDAAALACSLRSVNQNVAQRSPTRMYIWTRSSPLDVPDWLTYYPNVTVLFIPDDEWVMPKDYGSPSQWVLEQHTHASIYLASRWRLTHAFNFARTLGHRYILHIDPHAIVMEAFTMNIVATLTEHQRHLGYRNRMLQEDTTVASGLMELARFWMTIRNVDTPAGSLFSAAKTTTLSGVSSSAWNRHVFPTSFLIISVAFWFRADVQDFLQLVLNTGCDITQRWLDRGVFNIVALLFLPDSSTVRFPGTAVLDQPLKRSSDYETILQCPARQDGGGRMDKIRLESEAPVEDGSNSIVFLVGWEPTVILVVQGAQPIEEAVTFRWRYNISSYGRDTGALNNYTGILDRLMSRTVDVDWWEAHNIAQKLERLRAKPILPIDPASLDGEETLEIFQDQLDAYVDFFCADSAFVRSGARLPMYCGLIRRQAQGILTAQTKSLLQEMEVGS